MFTFLSNQWKAWSHDTHRAILIALIGIVVLGGLFTANQKKQESPETTESPAPRVQVALLSDITKNASVDITSTLTLTNSAPLIARTGGRVTGIRVPLGNAVVAGATVVDIDGRTEANPARVQIENAEISLRLFQDIKTQTSAALNNAVSIAEQAVSATRDSRSITASIQQKNIIAAENGVRVANVTRDQALIANNDLLIQSANIGVDAATLASQQATLAARLANTQTGNALTQAQQALVGARITRNQSLANLQSQEAVLQSQVHSATEQVRLMQVLAPLSGHVARLTVRVGDFVRPGDTVGEISTTGNATATVFVAEGIRALLTTGMDIPVHVSGKEETATITAIGNTPSAKTNLWQIDLSVHGTVSPNSTVRVSLPVHATSESHTLFVPLDALNIRESGAVVLTVDNKNTIHEHLFTPTHYYDTLVEGTSDLTSADRIITSGNRTLRSGEIVEISNS